MVYTSIHNHKIKYFKKLHTKKHRDQEGLFLIEGEHLVEEAFKKGFLKEVIILDGNNYEFDVPKTVVSSNVLKHLSELESPAEIIGVCKKMVSEVIGDRVLMLDGIQDPGNLGSIIRSAVAFNIDTVILSNDTVDLYNAKVVRATQGLLFHINIIRDDLVNNVLDLKRDGYMVYGTEVTGGKSLKNIVKINKFVIIVGNEGSGVSSKVKKLCDSLIYIDVNPVVESLNVGVAASIILYELDK